LLGSISKHQSFLRSHKLTSPKNSLFLPYKIPTQAAEKGEGVAGKKKKGQRENNSLPALFISIRSCALLLSTTTTTNLFSQRPFLRWSDANTVTLSPSAPLCASRMPPLSWRSRFLLLTSTSITTVARVVPCHCEKLSLIQPATQ